MDLLALSVVVGLNSPALAQTMPEQPVITPGGVGSMPMGANPDVPGIVTPPATPPVPRMQIIPAVPMQPVAPAPSTTLTTCPCDSTQVPPYTGSPMTRCPCL
jgi:hypothetical protein